MNSLTSIKHSLVSVVLTLLITILSVKMNDENSYLISTIVGVLAFVILIISIIGTTKAIKSLKEAKKLQVFFGFIINLFFLFLYSYLIISNI